MTPEAAVSRLAVLITSQPGMTEDEACSALEVEGASPDRANRAYKFALFAWGRKQLDGTGARFSPDYLCFDAAGHVVESGRIAEEPHYAAAVRIAPTYASRSGFAEFASSSSDVQSVNSALRAGSRAEDLVSAPAATFLEPPTEEGFAAARRHLMGQIAVPSAAMEEAIARKPWWRFWV